MPSPLPPDRPAPLPLPRAPLLGRERERAAACGLLLRDEVPLLMLTDPGGAGKTRLALQIVVDLAGGFAAGVAFVPLVPVTDPNLVLSAIAHALGVRERGDRPLLDRLAACLGDAHHLLVLDNLKQVLTAAPVVWNCWWPAHGCGRR